MPFKVLIAICAVVYCVEAQYNCGCDSGTVLGLAGNNQVYGNILSSSGYSAQSGINLAGCNNAYVGNGGGFTVTTYSPIAPSGISVLSENVIEGNLGINGALPVLSTAVFEGQIATSGQAGVQYGCGDGNVGITSQSNVGAGYAGGLAASGLASSALGYGAGMACGPYGSGVAYGGNSCGCGCNSY